MSNLNNSKNLSPLSKKKITFNCDLCNTEVEQSFYNYTKQSGELKLCRICRNKQTANLKHVKDKQSQKAKENWQNKEYREKTRNSLSISLTNSWRNKTDRTPINKTLWTDIVILFNRFLEMGFILITTENDWKTTNKIKCICSNNHEHEYSIAQLRSVKKCNKCIKKKSDKIFENKFEKIKKFYLNYKIEKKIWDGTRNSKLIFTCEKGHEFEFNNWQRYMSTNCIYEICPICRKDHKYDQLYKEAESEGYKILNFYMSDSGYTCFNFICPNKHEHHMFVINWMRKQRCGKCFCGGSSKKEKSIAEWVQSLGFFIEKNVRNVIEKLELDIYIPEKKLAIEFNGIYWHSSAIIKNNDYHKNKLNKCKEKGLDLIQVDELDWDRNPEAIKTLIKSKLRFK